MYFQQPLRVQLDKMKSFTEFLMLSCLVTALAHTLRKPAKSNDGLKEKRSDMNNYYYAGGQNCNKTEQQLAKIIEMLEEIRSSPPQNKNETGVTGPPKVNKNCADLYKSGIKISGVYKIKPDALGEFEVFCDQKTDRGGWTVFQRRRDGSVDFYRAWNEYKNGFGNLNGEFWLGLDKIHRLTVHGDYKLRVDLEDFEGNKAYAEYSSFGVTSEKAKYVLSLGSYSGKIISLSIYFLT